MVDSMLIGERCDRNYETVRTMSIPDPREPEPIVCLGDPLWWCSSSNSLLPTSFLEDASGVRAVLGGTRGEGDTFKYSLRWKG
jgi:hypothetical protein